MYRVISFLCFFFLFVGQLYAQLSFDFLSTTTQLSHSTVLSICKDSRGYMWFGTRHGLNRYDSRNLKIYYADTNSSSSLSSSKYIYVINEDHDKNLWIGTQNGLNRYIPETDSFEQIKYTSGKIGTISDRIILSISSSPKGRIWFGTNNGLSLLKNSRSRHFIRYYKKDGIAGNSIYAVHEDRHGNVWVGTTSGLTKMTPLKNKYVFSSFKYKASDITSISDNSIKVITEDSKGNIWIGTENGGINKYDEKTNSFVRFELNALKSNTISSNNIREIIVARDGRLWIATMDGLNIMDPETGSISVYRNDSENPKSLSDNSIKTLYEDDCGSFWIGTNFRGVCINHLDGLPFTIEKHSKYRNSISSNIISSICADKNRNLLIGTEGKGLNYYDIKKRKYINYVNDPSNSNSIQSNTIKDIYTDKEGRIWIGLFKGGMAQLNPRTGKFKHYSPDSNNPNAISHDYVSVIEEDKQGRFWVGTSSKGLNLFDKRTETFTVFTDSYNSKTRISSNYIKAIFGDSRSRLWVGTVDGLNLLPAGSTTFVQFYKGDSSKELLSSNITCINEDHKGNIWIGTYFGGMSKYNPHTNSFTSYTTKSGLPSDNINDFLEDNDGNLWVSTDKGLSKFDLQKETFRNYTTYDGLPSNEFNNNSAYKDENGKLYFGSYNGLVSFEPKKIELNKNVPKVVFSGLQLFNKPVSINGPDKLLNRDISFTSELIFNADQNIFTIEFLALNYITPEKNKFAYKLDGFEKDWNYISSPSATYTNLSPGDYTFLAKASNNDGLWNEVPSKIKIKILPPLWKTWWAYLFYFAGCSLILIFIIRFFRSKERLKAELYFQQMNHEQLKNVHQLKLEFFTRISHEIRTPLTLISAPMEKLIQHTSANNLVTKQLVQIKNNTDRLLRLISELLDFRKIESGNGKIKIGEYNLVSFCKEIFNSYTTLAGIRNIDIVFETETEQMLAYFDRDQMEKVLFNILSNAFKHTRDSVQMRLRDNDSQFLIYISDNGVGIPYENQNDIFKDFYQAGSGYSKRNTEGWGIGLALVKSIMEQHKGHVSVKSMPRSLGQSGETVFEVALKKGAEHFNAQEFIEHERLDPDVIDQQACKLENSVGVTDVEQKNYTILIIEDNTELRVFIKESLGKLYHILESDNGNSGWDEAVKSIPDLIISDVSMPGKDGFELCTMLKNDERTSHIPVILLTAMAAQTHHLNGLEAGADLYLTKPFSLHILELSIKNIIFSQEAFKQKYARQLIFEPRRLELQTRDEIFIDKLMTIIEDNLSDPGFKVTMLTRHIGISQTVLYNKIKALTGMTINDFVKSLRLKRSVQLLKENQLNISEIAYAVGFSDRKYFSKEFKKQYGVAPSGYIKKD